MGTFTPAGFTFGDSIVKERMQKRQIQAEMERASQQAALQISLKCIAGGSISCRGVVAAIVSAFTVSASAGSKRYYTKHC